MIPLLQYFPLVQYHTYYWNFIVCSRCVLMTACFDLQEKFFTARNSRFEHVDYGDISSRLKLRETMKCHDFTWYLSNIFDPSNKRKQHKVAIPPQVHQAMKLPPVPEEKGKVR